MNGIFWRTNANSRRLNRRLTSRKEPIHSFGFGFGAAALIVAAFLLADGPPPEASPTPALRDDTFVATVRPVLSAHCAPCHEPGGKMYDRLPFDRPETIASHREGVLRRLKGGDRETVEKWLATLPPSK